MPHLIEVMNKQYAEIHQQNMSTIQIESLWQYIQSLSLSKRNRKWLAERLLANDNAEEKPNATTLQAIKEAEDGEATTFTSLDDFKKHMYEL